MIIFQVDNSLRSLWLCLLDTFFIMWLCIWLLFIPTAWIYATCTHMGVWFSTIYGPDHSNSEWWYIAFFSYHSSCASQYCSWKWKTIVTIFTLNHFVAWTGTIMTISKDRVKPSPLPDSWKLAEIFTTGVVLGGYLAMMTVIFFWAAYKTNFFPVRSTEMATDFNLFC